MPIGLDSSTLLTSRTGRTNRTMKIISNRRNRAIKGDQGYLRSTKLI